MSFARFGSFLVVVFMAFGAQARGGERVTSRVDLRTGRVDAIAPALIPIVRAQRSPSPPHAEASVRAGVVNMTDLSGAVHVIANVDPRSWLTWQLEVGGVLVFAVRTFTVGLARDDGHDVVRAYSAAGLPLWNRTSAGWIPAAYEMAGALAMASENRIDLVHPTTAAPRCTGTLTQPGWPLGVVDVDPNLIVYQTTARTYAIDPSSCAIRWSASGRWRRVPVLHRGKLYDVATVHTPTGGRLDVVERDARTGVLGRTFAAASYVGQFDQAGANVTPVGDTLFVDAAFIILD